MATAQNPAQQRVISPRLSVVARVTQAGIAFRQGLPVAITKGGHAAIAYALETLTDESLQDMCEGVLLLTPERARTLHIPLYTDEVIALPLAPSATLESLLAIADPTVDLDHPLKGPFHPLREKLPFGYAASIKLAKLAGLLPTVVAIPADHPPTEMLIVSVDDIQDYERASVDSLALVTRARVPLEGAENTELVAFRAPDGGPEHYAILVNAPPPHEPVLTRLHSECFTGDLLGSLKCDCGPQLRGAIDTIARAGGGVVLYLAQEGRGIGLVNKLRAYRLQDQGFDTLQANERLGFEADERLYEVAAKMLRLLRYSAVRLLTNNPEKVKALQQAGIAVVERVPHRFAATDHNRGYLQTKAKAGHLL